MILIDNDYYFEQERLSKDIWSIANPKQLDIKNKIKSKGIESSKTESRKIKSKKLNQKNLNQEKLNKKE